MNKIVITLAVLLLSYEINITDVNSNIDTNTILDNTISTTENIEVTKEDVESEIDFDKKVTTITIVEEKDEEIHSTKINTDERKKEALELAKSYIEASTFSKSGLIKQLEYEGYTKKEATYAANRCGADWNEEAIEFALKHTPCSKESLESYLSCFGFTSSQIKFALKEIGY